MTAVYGSQSWHSVGKEPVSTHRSRTRNLGYQSSPIPDVAGTDQVAQDNMPVWARPASFKCRDESSIGRTLLATMAPLAQWRDGDRSRTVEFFCMGDFLFGRKPV